jgi:hypothetical protein
MSAAQPVLALTLDTDVIRDVWDDDGRKVHVERLIQLACEGRVDLAVTRHIEEDVPHSPLADRVAELPELAISRTGGVFVIGVSRLDGIDGLGSGAFDEWWRALGARRKDGDPGLPGLRDYHHLHAHYIRGRDVFVTWDKAILRVAPLLAETFDMRVMTPESVLVLVEDGARG